MSATITVSDLNTNPRRFAEEGYCVFRHVLRPDEIAAARRVLDEAIAALPKRKVVRDGVEVEEEGRPEYLTEPHTKEHFWLELCRHPRVLDIVESVLGPNLILLMSHLIVKRANDGLRVEWHQDNTTWDSVHGTDVVTVWLAVDDADCGNGCMEVIASSHAGYEEMEKLQTDGADLLGLKVAVTPQMEAAAIPLELAAGDASIHDSYILHGSSVNTSSRRRAGYTMRYANALTTQVDVASHFAPVYLVRGEAANGGEGYIDVRPGVSDS